jgi:hypothetical protein
MRYLLILILLAACSKNKPSEADQERMESEYEFIDCVSVGHYIKRCHNTEVVCYRYKLERTVHCISKTTSHTTWSNNQLH